MRRKVKRENLRGYHFFLAYSSVWWRVCGWGNLEAMAVSIPFPVSREPFFFSFVALVERKAGATWALRGFARQAQKSSPHSHQQVVTTPLSLRALNDHSGTSNLPQAQWVNSVSVLLTCWRGETEVGIEGAEVKGQAQMSAKISLDSLGSQPSNYRRFKQTINEHSTCKNELPFVSLLPSVH